MKNIYIILIMTLVLLLRGSSFSQQVVFEKKFPGIDILPGNFVYKSGYPRQVVELPDSNILLLGWGYSMDTTGQSASRTYQDLKKLDKNGNVIWTRYFMSDSVPGVNTELNLNSFELMGNGNILLTGEKLNGSGTELPLACLIMLDSDGQQLFDTVYYSDTVLMKPQCSAKSSDGIAIGGYRFKYGDHTAYAFKVDSNFQIEWQFDLDPAYGGVYSEYKTILANADGSFDCYGQMRENPSDPFVFLYVHLNPQGLMTIVKTYADTASPLTFMDACGGQGFRLLMGYRYDENMRITLFKTDEGGDLIWQKKFTDTADVMYLPRAITVNSQNEILIAGEKDYHDTLYQMWESSDIYLLKTDSSGNKLWDATYGTDLVFDSCQWACWEGGWDVFPAMDGTYLVCASNNIDAVYGPVMDVLKIREGFLGEPIFATRPDKAILYPNPVNSQARLQLPEGVTLENGVMRIINQMGMEVKRTFGLQGHIVILDRNGLQEGIYIYQLLDQEKIIAEGKMVVIR